MGSVMNSEEMGHSKILMSIVVVSVPSCCCYWREEEEGALATSVAEEGEERKYEDDEDKKASPSSSLSLSLISVSTTSFSSAFTVPVVGVSSYYWPFSSLASLLPHFLALLLAQLFWIDKQPLR